MSASKFVIGGIFVVAALVSIVPLFKRDLGSYSKQEVMQEKNNSEQGQFQPVASSNNLSSTDATNNIIGSYNGVIVKQDDLSAQEKQSLFDAQTQMYKADENILAKRYIDSVITKFAKDKKILDRNEAQQQYVQENVRVSDADVKAFIKQNSDNPQLKGKSPAEQLELVKPYLMQRAAGDYFKDVIAKAKEKGLIKVTGLKLPESPRIKIDIGDSPSKGPTNAPITIIEFADFQCPFCYSADPTVKAVLKKYKDKVRLVFKNYPLIQLHPQAVNAGIAAECAQKQGKFWEMHDVLFENHRTLSDSAYEGFAKTVGLDINKFKTCFNDPKIKAKIMDEEEYGQSLGINATPAFYINGILLMGAQPESEFVRIIEKELAAHK